MTTTETSTETPIQTSAVETTIEDYFTMWNEPDRAKRLEVIARAWAPGARYVDPLSVVAGHDGIADMVEGVRVQFPGATLQRTTDVDTHHNVVKFGWSATGPDGDVLVGGTDVGVLTDDGRLSAVAGFFS